MIPFVKLPTAKHSIGNGKVEGGLAVPISISTGGPVTLMLGPEVDLLADADGDGHHAALVNLVNVSARSREGLTLNRRTMDANRFRSGGPRHPCFGGYGAGVARHRAVQFDLGANFGLTRIQPISSCMRDCLCASSGPCLLPGFC